MSQEKSLNSLPYTIIAVCAILALAPFAWADHWASSVVPPHGEEALTWCGPATAQMIMEGYPAGGCSESQTNIWGVILSHKVEAMWDTDPAGLRGAMLDLCPLPPTPPGTWSIYHNTDPAVIMHRAAKWMTRRNYPVAVLLNTSSHNTCTSHQEHWAAIQSIKTDLDPTTNTTVTLKTVVIVDPAVPYTTTPTPQWISGSDWYSTEFQSVTKAGSSYLNEYVAIVEPPKIKGWALAPPEVLTGRLITPEDAIRHVLKGLKEEGLYEMDAFRVLKKLKPVGPLLVNRNFGGYYLIPFTVDGKAGPANAAVLVNAYTGFLKQVKVYKEPVRFLKKDEAMEIALKFLKEKPEMARAELVHQRGSQSPNKFFPIWQVIVNKKGVRVDREGKIITKIFKEEHSLPLPGPDPQGLTWDGKNLLVVDGETKELYKLDPYAGRVLQSFGLKVKQPKGLTFDGESIWLADEGTRKIHSIDPNNGRIIKTIEMDTIRARGFKSFEGLTWDGKYLWTAYFAGFSSAFNQIDPENGRIIRSVFADCYPRGIASDGKYIWSICCNGEKLSSKIDRRTILEKEHEMLASRVFIEDIEDRDPIGLEYAGQNLWYADRKSKKVFRIRVSEEEKKAIR